MDQGKCAKCGSEHIDYGMQENEGDYLYYPYTYRDCKHEGKEFYNIEYAESE